MTGRPKARWMKRSRIIRFEVTRGRLTALGVMVLLCGAAYQAASDKLTFTTYYPSPFGVYGNIITTEKTVLARDSGNVGIGTTDPKAKLTVAGLIETTFGGVKFPDGTIQATAGGLWKGSGASIYNVNTGSVGIGMTNPNPLAKLDVGGHARVAGVLALGQQPDSQEPNLPKVNGAIYYNTDRKVFRGYQNGAWTDLATGGSRGSYSGLCQATKAGPECCQATHPPAACGGYPGILQICRLMALNCGLPSRDGTEPSRGCRLG